MHDHSGNVLCKKCSLFYLKHFMAELPKAKVFMADSIVNQNFHGDTILIAEEIKNVKIFNGSCRLFSSRCQSVVFMPGTVNHAFLTPVKSELWPGVEIINGTCTVHLMFIEEETTMRLGGGPLETHDIKTWLDIFERNAIVTDGAKLTRR